MLALLITLMALMACVLPTQEADGTAPPEQTAAPAASPTAVPVDSTPAAATAVPAPTTPAVAPPSGTQPSGPPAMNLDSASTYAADIRTNYGNFRVDLLSSQAPITVNNFVALSLQGFYNGLIFHRVIDGFMIQGGDPTGTGAGGPGYQFQDEIVPGVSFDTPWKLAMANAGPDTNGSQFFITVSATPWLDGKHTIFGDVTEGQSVVDAISKAATGQRDVPLQRVIIERIDIIQAPR